MRGRLYGLLAKEFVQVLRDPVILFLVFWMYTVELVMCTTALGFDVKYLELGVIDHDRSAASRAFVRELTSADTFVLEEELTSMSDGERRLQTGSLAVLVEIPPDFGARVAGGRQAQVGVIVDGTNGNVAARARAYVIEMAARFSETHAVHAETLRPRAEAMVRVWYNPDLTNTRFMALAMLAQVGLMLGVVMPAAALVREKQSGTIEQLRITPTRAHELFIAKVAPALVICLGAVIPTLLIITLLGVPMRGDVLTLEVMTFAFLLSAVSIGVFVSSITSTLQQAMLVSFFGLFPLLFLSGTVAPVESMPGWLQVASLASPLRHYVEIISGLFLKGAGYAELWPHAATLIGISAPMFAAAWLLFKRQW